jgi:predicted transposase/invertase (TIGR01784 family)
MTNEIASEEEIVMAIKSMRQALADKEFREMINFREKARLDELYRRNQDLAAAEMKGKLEGLQKGKLEGKLEGKLNVAARMLKSGLKPEQIADFTGLNLEEIQKLIH